MLPWLALLAACAPDAPVDTAPEDTADSADPCDRPLYRDLDGDGFGGEWVATGCLVAGTSKVPGDCDDTDPAVGDTRAWYADADGDGFGDAGAIVTGGCTPPDGAAATATDCDDGDAALHPDAAEVCGDGVDNNCDAAPAPCLASGETRVSTRSAAATFLGTGERDYLGYHGLSRAGDLDGDGHDDVLLAAPNHTGDLGGDGAAYVFFGPVSGTVSVASADVTFVGTEQDGRLGRSVLGNVDFDGDGRPDVALGVGHAEMGVRIYTSVDRATLGPDDAATVVTDGERDTFGNGLTSGDLDGDGAADLVVAHSEWEEIGVTAYLGPFAPGVRPIAGADLTVASERVGHSIGESMVVADLDGDGVAELIVGGEDAAYVLAGGTRGALSLPGDADTVLSIGRSTYPAFVTLDAGDLDHDGLDDLVVNADDVGVGGAVYVAFSPFLATGWGPIDLAGAGATILAEGTSDFLGATLSASDDLTGDNVDDLVLGAGYADGGTVYVFAGPMSASVALADAHAMLISTSGRYEDQLGGGVATAGDLDGDGVLDLLVGAPYSHDAAFWSGAVYLLLGGGP